ncbi:Hypothetical protein LUCI_1720 [Lucifera butyrica]|uniref:Uncharacterized protein n=1 Tax=Lucifera butyrica TaxID=1351585 RepID=A0A498R6I4_9FIRM|nr:hypothetical protein [Lucifera butyrica]VBB06487.1 Hypothetical protein LUCI_1720 [Lucifera butyrica]
MSNDISSIQNQIQNTQVHHGGGGHGHGHGKKINDMQNVFSMDEKETKVKPKTRLQSEHSAKIDVNPDADSKQQKQQQKEKSSEEQTKDKKPAEKKPLGLDALEIIGQMNRMSIYTLNNIKKP